MNHPQPKLVTGCDRFGFTSTDCGPVCRSGGISYPVSTSLLRPLSTLNTDGSSAQLPTTNLPPPLDSVSYDNSAMRNIFAANEQQMYHHHVGTPPCVNGPPVGFLPRVSYNSFLLNCSSAVGSADCYSGLYPGGGGQSAPLLPSPFLTPVEQKAAAHGDGGGVGLVCHFPGSQVLRAPTSVSINDSRHVLTDSGGGGHRRKSFNDAALFNERVGAPLNGSNYPFTAMSDAGLSTSLTSWPDQHAASGQTCNGTDVDILAQYYSHHVHGGDDRLSVVCPILPPATGQSPLNSDLARTAPGTVVDYQKFFPKFVASATGDHHQQLLVTSQDASPYFTKAAAAVVNPYFGRSSTGAFNIGSSHPGTLPNYFVDYNRQQQQSKLHLATPSGGVIVKSEVSLMPGQATPSHLPSDVSNIPKRTANEFDAIPAFHQFAAGDCVPYNVAASFRGTESVGSVLFNRHGFLPTTNKVENNSNNLSDAYGLADPTNLVCGTTDDMMAMERFKYMQQVGAYMEQGGGMSTQRYKHTVTGELRQHSVKMEHGMIMNEDQFSSTFATDSMLAGTGSGCESAYQPIIVDQPDARSTGFSVEWLRGEIFFSSSCVPDARQENVTSPVAFVPLADFDPVEGSREATPSSSSGGNGSKEYAEVFIPTPCVERDDDGSKVPIYKQHQPRKIEQPRGPHNDDSPYSFTDDDEAAGHFSPVNIRSTFPGAVDDDSRTERKWNTTGSSAGGSELKVRGRGGAGGAMTTGSSCSTFQSERFTSQPSVHCAGPAAFTAETSMPKKRLKMENDFHFQPESGWLTGAVKATADGVKNHGRSLTPDGNCYPTGGISSSEATNVRSAIPVPVVETLAERTVATDDAFAYVTVASSAQSTSKSRTATRRTSTPTTSSGSCIEERVAYRSGYKSSFQPRIVIRIPKHALAIDEIVVANEDMDRTASSSSSAMPEASCSSSFQEQIIISSNSSVARCSSASDSTSLSLEPQVSVISTVAGGDAGGTSPNSRIESRTSKDGGNTNEGVLAVPEDVHLIKAAGLSDCGVKRGAAVDDDDGAAASAVLSPCK